MWICCQGRQIFLIYWESNAQNTGEKLSGLHKCFTEKKNLSSRLLQAVAMMKWHQELPGKWRNNAVQQSFFFDFAPAFFIPVAPVITTLRQRMFYNCKYFKKDCRSTFYNEKYGVRVNPVCLRKLVYLKVRFEGRPVWQMEQYNCHFFRKLCRFIVK